MIAAAWHNKSVILQAMGRVAEASIAAQRAQALGK
jgi:hypothetical protein